MTELEKLQHRRRKLDEFWNSLTDEEKIVADGSFIKSTILANVVGQEINDVELKIAKIRMDEFINIDEIFEKEVLD